ncbi:MAG TPA: hypothetical protein VGG75_29860 [Trebonia sp.]|jgi:hypothetical protein
MRLVAAMTGAAAAVPGIRPPGRPRDPAGTARGAVILPPAPAFRNRPAGAGGIIGHVAARVPGQPGLPAPGAARREGPGSHPHAAALEPAGGSGAL